MYTNIRTPALTLLAEHKRHLACPRHGKLPPTPTRLRHIRPRERRKVLRRRLPVRLAPCHTLRKIELELDAGRVWIHGDNVVGVARGRADDDGTAGDGGVGAADGVEGGVR